MPNPTHLVFNPIKNIPISTCSLREAEERVRMLAEQGVALDYRPLSAFEQTPEGRRSLELLAEAQGDKERFKALWARENIARHQSKHRVPERVHGLMAMAER